MNIGIFFAREIGSVLGELALMAASYKVTVEPELALPSSKENGKKIAANKLPHGKASIERAVKRADMPTAR